MFVESHSGSLEFDPALPPSVDTRTADGELRRRVSNYLQSKLRRNASTLQINAANGVVTIRGTVRSFYHKQQCIHCCQRVAGVVRLIDDTQVVSVN